MAAPRSVNPLNRNKLESLTTKRLLAYLRNLQQCEESIEASDWEEEKVNSKDGIVFKSSEEWRSQYNLVKTVLAERPNIE
jgi:hypothetical protein